VLAERARPYLLTTDAHASTDFINAVYVDVRVSVLPFVDINRPDGYSVKSIPLSMAYIERAFSDGRG